MRQKEKECSSLFLSTPSINVSTFLIFPLKSYCISVIPALYSSGAEQSNQGIIQIHQFPSIMQASLVKTVSQSNTPPQEQESDRYSLSSQSADRHDIKRSENTPCSLKNIQCHS